MVPMLLKVLNRIYRYTLPIVDVIHFIGTRAERDYNDCVVYSYCISFDVPEWKTKMTRE